MPPKIGPKRLMTLLEQGTDLYALPVQQQVQAFITMARLMTQAPAGTPRRLPRRLRPRCMARRRDGRRCQAKVAWDTEHDRPRNTKCRIHGGVSRGPTTPEGRRRIGESNRQRAQARRQAQAQAAEHASAQAAALAQAQAQAAARAEALAAYQAAMAKYEELRQHPMPDSRFKAALMQVQKREVERRRQACLDCGADPRA